jgi:hypothetical protein
MSKQAIPEGWEVIETPKGFEVWKTRTASERARSFRFSARTRAQAVAGINGRRRGGRPPASKPSPSKFGVWVRGRAALGLSVNNVAELLGVGRSTVYALMGGTRQPGRRLALDIEDLTGGEILARSWAK